MADRGALFVKYWSVKGPSAPWPRIKVPLSEKGLGPAGLMHLTCLLVISEHQCTDLLSITDGRLLDTGGCIRNTLCILREKVCNVTGLVGYE